MISGDCAFGSLTRFFLKAERLRIGRIMSATTSLLASSDFRCFTETQVLLFQSVQAEMGRQLMITSVSLLLLATCSVGWFISLLVREEVLLAGLCERKILFLLKIYDSLRQATAKRTGCGLLGNKAEMTSHCAFSFLGS